MPIYNLLEYSNNCSMTSASLWNYYRDGANEDANENNSACDYRISNNETTTSKYFEYQTKIIGNTANNNNYRLNTKVIVRLTYLFKFLRSLVLPLINYEIEIHLAWSKYCIISEITRTLNINANLPNPPIPPTQTAGALFQTTSSKLYVSVATLSINDNIKFLENLKQGFKRKTSWKKYKSEITTQAKNNNLYYMIDPTIRKTDRLFLVSFKTDDDDDPK